jgi:hypothetical protein
MRWFLILAGIFSQTGTSAFPNECAKSMPRMFSAFLAHEETSPAGLSLQRMG